MPGLLEAALPEATGVPVAVRNAGIGGWAPSQYLLRARTLLSQDQYELVITALFVGNDIGPTRREYVAPLAPTLRHAFDVPTRLTWPDLVTSLFRPANDVLEERSHLFLFARHRLKTLRMRVGLSPLYLPPQFLRASASSDMWTTTAEVCREINEVATSGGARALFILIPARFQVEPDDFRSYLRGFGLDPGAIDLEQASRLLGKELETRGLAVVDALPAFRTAHESGHRLYGRVDIHLSPEGHRMLAGLVAPFAASLIDIRP